MNKSIDKVIVVRWYPIATIHTLIDYHSPNTLKIIICVQASSARAQLIIRIFSDGNQRLQT